MTFSDTFRQSIREVNERLRGRRVEIIPWSSRISLRKAAEEDVYGTAVEIVPQQIVGIVCDVVNTEERVLVIDTGEDVFELSPLDARVVTSEEIAATIHEKNPYTVWGGDEAETSYTADRGLSPSGRETRFVEPTLNGEPIPEIVISLNDGSVFVIDEPVIGKAVLIAGDGTIDEICAKLVAKVESKFSGSTATTQETEAEEHVVRYSESSEDGSEPAFHADVASDVVYSSLRPLILSITLSCLQSREDNDDEWESNDMTVVGIGDEPTVYTGDGYIRYSG